MSFLLLGLGVFLFLGVMWRLLNFVGDLIEYWISERNKEHDELP